MLWSGSNLTSLSLPFQVSIVAFKKGQLRVLSHAWDRNLGGRDLDNALFEYFAQEFQEKYKLDVRTNARASFRLRMACEKVWCPSMQRWWLHSARDGDELCRSR